MDLLHGSITPMVMMFAVNENTYEVEITFNPLVHHHLSLIFILGHPRYSSHSSSNESEPRNCNKGTHTHTHLPTLRQTDVEPSQFVISLNREPPINSSVKNPK
jgi:hypothetical protein